MRFPPTGKAVTRLLREACGREWLSVAHTCGPGARHGGSRRHCHLGQRGSPFVSSSERQERAQTSQGREGLDETGPPGGDGCPRRDSQCGLCPSSGPHNLPRCLETFCVCPGPLLASRSCGARLSVPQVLASRTGHVSRGCEWLSHRPLS